MTPTRELPMFPLGTVVFPGTAIPLHVFEPRYRALTGWCVEHDGRFGTVLIERGSEVGGGDERVAIGTQVQIVESQALPDGHWLLAALGERRIRVQHWLGEEPFPRAEVALLDDPLPVPAVSTTSPALARARDRVVERVGRALTLMVSLGEWPGDVPPPALSEDPTLAGWQAAGLGLLGPADAQRVLETDGLSDRLELAAVLLEEAIELLALRAGEQ